MWMRTTMLVSHLGKEGGTAVMPGCLHIAQQIPVFLRDTFPVWLSVKSFVDD
jgi:hypothetical protein